MLCRSICTSIDATLQHALLASHQGAALQAVRPDVCRVLVSQLRAEYKDPQVAPSLCLAVSSTAQLQHLPAAHLPPGFDPRADLVDTGALSVCSLRLALMRADVYSGAILAGLLETLCGLPDSRRAL